MATRLTKKEKGFVDDWLELGNATRAALKNYDTTNENVAAAIGSINLRKRKITDYIESQAAGAALRMRELSQKAKNEQVRFNATKDMLDRAGFKPQDKVDLTSKGEKIYQWAEFADKDQKPTP
jgi:phage terminase small subunit